MKPEKLILQNIGPFRGTHSIDFTALGDIFLVYGKTGAGKTTVFDAISFAFYGKVPGSRNGIERQMRSQFADGNDPTAVEMVFTTSGRRYRIRRTLAYEKIGVRSGKTVAVQEESSLEECVSGIWQNRSSTNKGDTDRKILDIIKLSAEEFSRIVLLPQGEFARFLKLNSNERKDVLAKLFPVERYTRVTELARNRAKEAKLRVDEIENSALLLRKQFNRLSWEADRENLETEIAALRDRQATLRKELGEKSALLEKARAAGEKRNQEVRLAAGLAEFEKRADEYAGKERALADARRASPLAVELAALEGSRERLEKLSADLEATERERAERSGQLAELERREPEITAAAKEKDALLVRKEQLQTAVKIAETLDALESEYDATMKELAAERKRLELAEAENAKRNARLSSLAPDIDAFDEREKRHGLARDELERRKAARDLAQEYAREAKSRDAHRETVMRADEALSRNRNDLAIAKNELADLESEAAAGKENDLASSLAARLADGKPCPVCGSIHHPAPAVKRQENAFSIAERIDAAKRRCEALEGELARIGQERAARNANLATAEERLARIVSNSALPGGIPSPDEAAKALEEAARDMQEASDRLGLSRVALREAGEIRAKIAREEPECARTRALISDLDIRAVGQRAEIAHAKARYREAFSMPKPAMAAAETGATATEAAGSVSETDAADELERCTAKILGIEAALSAHETRLSATRMRLSSLGGKKEELERTASNLRGEIAARAEAFAAGCARASFPDGEAVRKAALPVNEQNRLEADINAFNRDMANTKTLLERVRAEIAGWHGPDPGTVQADIAEGERIFEETGRALEGKAASLASLDNLKARWDDLEKERARRAIEGARLKALADDLTGVNPAKTSFDAWILGMYLEEITAYANTRLEKMSDGRYRIKLNENYRKGNSLAGLDLEILDAHTGKTRPTGTLSGGETFMTSISLALGLADSIQSRSGGVQLDAVFIDEGFGSLDESSLERAITILDEIRGSRMVGLISHVGELRNRIPNRIEIIKTGAGSEIRADTGNPAEP